jgi:hypothetical protein
VGGEEAESEKHPLEEEEAYLFEILQFSMVCTFLTLTG